MKTDLNKIAELYHTASKEVQEFVNSENLQKTFVSLEKIFKLKEDETRVIQEQSIAFLFELVSLDEIETELALALRDRSSAEIENIINSIKREVLSKRSSK